MNAQSSIVAGDGDDAPTEWIVAAHEAGWNEPDPFYERTEK